MKLRKWRLLMLFFLALVIVLSVILVFNIYPKNLVQQTTPQIQSPQISAVCSGIQLNNTNLTEFSMKMQYSQSEHLINNFKIQQSNSKIVSLDLSSNLLQKFSDNNLPDLQSLNLKNNWIKTFSNNNFPKLNDSGCTYNLWQIDRFQHNSLPLIKFGNSFNTIFINYFNYNNMPSLRGQQQFYKFKEMIGNTLGVSGLRLYVNDQGFQFHNNTLHDLEDLVLFCPFNGIDDTPISSDKFRFNSFKKLKHLGVVCNLLNFYQTKDFEQLQELTLGFVSDRQGGIQQFSNYSFPQMKTLYLQANVYGSTLKRFTLNQLPKLTELWIESNNMTDVCTGNYMPNLNSLKLHQYNNKLNLNCFNNLQNLEYFSALLKQSVQGLTFPVLKNFTLNVVDKSSLFSNNSFPRLQRFSVRNIYSTQDFKDSNVNIGSSLKQFDLRESNIKRFSFDKDMPNLISLYIVESNLESFDCSTMKNVKVLLLSANKLKDDIADVLVKCNFSRVTDIYLQQNLIVDKPAARAKLSSRYPTTKISL